MHFGNMSAKESRRGLGKKSLSGILQEANLLGKKLKNLKCIVAAVAASHCFQAGSLLPTRGHDPGGWFKEWAIQVDLSRGTRKPLGRGLGAGSQAG